MESKLSQTWGLSCIYKWFSFVYSWIGLVSMSAVPGSLSYYLKYIVPYADSSTYPYFLFCLTVTLTFCVRTWKFTGLMREVLLVYQPSVEEIRWKNNRKKFRWHITEIADCAFSSSVTLWPWPLTFAPINVYICSTSYCLSTGQIWERLDEKWQRNSRTQIVGKI